MKDTGYCLIAAPGLQEAFQNGDYDRENNPGLGFLGFRVSGCDASRRVSTVASTACFDVLLTFAFPPTL